MPHFRFLAATVVCLLVFLTGLTAQTTSAAFVYRRDLSLADATASVGQPGSFANASVRAQGGSGDDTLTAGFIINGSGRKPLLIRAVGAGLAHQGVHNVMSAPVLQVHDLVTHLVTAQNRDWKTGPNLPALLNATTQLGAFPLAADSDDSALFNTVGAGWYTATVDNATSGVGLVELYDANPYDSTRLINLSTRARAEPGEKALILGFVIVGDNPKPLLLRGIGPTLASQGVSGVLADPQLSLVKSTGEKIAFNDNWAASRTLANVSSQVGAFALPAGSKDAAIFAILPAGIYSALLTGANDTSGVAMIELYDVPPSALETRWTMINVSPAEAQADCHLIEFPDGRRVLIDVADAADAEGSALAYLRAHGIDRVDLVVLSHFHRDHYGRLADLVRAGIKVGRVAYNLPAPDDELADAERPWGFDRDDATALLNLLHANGIPCFTPQAGERLIECPLGDGTVAALDTVCLYDGTHTPVGKTDTNDTSIILRLSHGKTRALFTGDLNYALGAWLATSGFDLAADILKAPHHGTTGCAPPEFFDRVKPRAVMVPSPTALWHSVRSKLQRDYFEERQIPAFVNGERGHVTATLTRDGFSIETER